MQQILPGKRPEHMHHGQPIVGPDLVQYKTPRPLNHLSGQTCLSESVNSAAVQGVPHPPPHPAMISPTLIDANLILQQWQQLALLVSINDLRYTRSPIEAARRHYRQEQFTRHTTTHRYTSNSSSNTEQQS
eukprot:GHUV01037491.1.p1 GENE.GHUV01037491.1~~GHUV01037491.1.p1  ORF type:complete len:131 (-),score=19.34 GHUV01037491.1:206-598(-)